MIIRATTTPGLEDVARAEGTRLLAQAGFLTPDGGVDEREPNPFDLPGVVGWTLSPDVTFDALRSRNPLLPARSLYHLAVHVRELDWDGSTLDSLVAASEDAGLDEMARARSFRVSCTRTGEHAFRSPDVERSIGAALQDRYGTPVDLERYALHVKIDVTGARAFAGYQLTGRKGLDRRHRWVYHPRVTLRTPIAHGMLVLSGFAARPGPLYDPFCGSGTILLEAAGLLGSASEAADGLFGSDWDERAVAGATANLAAAGLAGVTVSRRDAREIHASRPPRSLDYIVTNPPFGIRIGRGANLLSLYRDFLSSAAVVLRPDGVLALLVARRRGAFNKVLQGFPEFALAHVRVIEMGGVYAGLFVLRRTRTADAVDPGAHAE